MLQSQNPLMKRGTLPGKDPRVDQKVRAAVGFSDFAAVVSVIFSACCPAAVSESETVFLCPLHLWTPARSIADQTFQYSF
jgi:hypothetical protein